MTATLAFGLPNVLHNLGEVFDTWALNGHALGAAGRLIWSSLLLLVIIGGCMVMTKRPKSPEPTTWAQAMLGAVAVVGVMLLGYGTVPHEWLNFANAYLKWDDAHFIVHKNQELVGGIKWLAFDISKTAIKDTVAVGIYGFVLVTNMILFAKWQKRPVRREADAPKAEEQVVGTSAFGRPVTVQG